MNYFSRNLESISRRFPNIAGQIAGNKRLLDIEVFFAKNSQPAFSLKTQDKGEIFFHSQLDPGKEATDFAASQDFKGATVLFLYGLGFGYHLKEIRKKFSGLIFVIEPSPEILAVAMEHVDLAEVIDQENVFLLTDVLLVQQIIVLYSGLMKAGLERFVSVMHPAYSYFKEYFSLLKSGLDTNLANRISGSSRSVIESIIRFYLCKFKESSYKDQALFNRMRFISSFFSIYEPFIQMLFDNAFFLYECEDYPLSLEAFNAAWAEDSIRLNNKFFENRDLVAKTAGCYGRIAELYGDKIRSVSLLPKKYVPKINIAHIASNFIDDTHSPTRLLRTFAEYHDQDKFNLYMYSSEMGASRTERQYYIGVITDPSIVRGGRFISFLKGKGVPVYLSPVSGTHIDSASALFKRISDDKIDIVFYHASMFSTADFLVSIWRPAPVQINVNIGSFMYSRGLDAVTYFVPAAYEQEKGIWESAHIHARLMPSGADFHDRMGAATINKADYGFLEDTVIFVTVGNHLDTRIAERFLEVIARQLSKGNCAWLVIGDGDFTFQHSYLSGRNLLSRVRFLGARQDVFSFYEMADIYVNEFPQGGGMSVLEAMSVGLPVVALNAGAHHLENCGANYVGRECAAVNEEGYADFLGLLTRDKKKREEVGYLMRKRYQEQFSPRIMVQAFEDLAMDLYKQKVSALP